MSDSFAYDSTDLAGTSYGVTVVGLKMESLAAPILDTMPIAQAFGGATRANAYGSKSIELATYMDFASGGATQQTRIDNIKYLLDPKRNGGKKLALDAFSDRYWYAFLDAPVDEGKIATLSGKYTFRFICPDSRAFSTTNRTLNDFTITSNPQTFNTESVAGTAPCTMDLTAPSLCPVWVVKNTSGAAITMMSLKNNTTNETVTVVANIANGAWLRFSVGTQAVELSTDSGASYSSYLASTAAGSVIPTLNPGINSMTLTGYSTATIVLTYTARYL